MNLGFAKSDVNPNLYYKVVKGEPVILLLYADDLFLIGGENLIDQCKRELTFEFKMKDLDLMHYFLGQGKYTIEILQRFGMVDCKSMETHMVTNLKKLRGSDLDLVDPMMYRQSGKVEGPIVQVVVMGSRLLD